MHNFDPAVRQMTVVVAGVTDDQLTAPTPCPGYAVGDLLDHIGGLALAFAAAAAKEQGVNSSPPPPGDASRLDAEWRARITADLSALAVAWADPNAWEGMTVIAGGEAPAAVVGAIALEELVAHGWDLARATGQPFGADPVIVDACIEVMAPMSAPGMEAAREPAFGPVVEVTADVSPLDRLLALTGRDPGWTED